MGEQLFEKVKDLSIKFTKPSTVELLTRGWKKMSISFELLYWWLLYVRHFLDIMYIEKNIYDSVIGKLLNGLGKTKDDINARLDIVSRGIRRALCNRLCFTELFFYL